MEALLLDEVLKAAITVVQYVLNVVFPFVKGRQYVPWPRSEVRR
jgi:hypothetical protein